MRKLIVVEFMSLDGVIQAPGAPQEDTGGGFRFGGWQAPFDEAAVGEAIMALYAQPFELLLGRHTWDIWAAYWPVIAARSPEHPIAAPFDRVRKHVATHRPESLSWNNSHALKGEPAEAVRALKAEDGGVLITHGSGVLVKQLLAAGLVDELRLMTYPLTLGAGKRLFGHDALPATWTLAESVITTGGVVIGRYLPGGEVRTGSFDERQ